MLTRAGSSSGSASEGLGDPEQLLKCSPRTLPPFQSKGNHRSYREALGISRSESMVAGTSSMLQQWGVPYCLTSMDFTG